MAQIEFGLIAPAYDEATKGDGFKRFLEDGLNTFDESELLLVDDGSSDNTAEVARLAGWPTISLPRHLGKSAAIRSGVETMDGVPGLAFVDSDGQYRMEDVLRLRDLTEDADIAIAKRSSDSPISLWRSISHSAFSLLGSVIAPTGVSDPQAGAMSFSGEAAIDLWKDVTSNGYFGPYEVLYRANKLGLMVAEQTVDVQPSQGSNVRFLSDSAIMLASLVRLRFSSYSSQSRATNRLERVERKSQNTNLRIP